MGREHINYKNQNQHTHSSTLKAKAKLSYLPDLTLVGGSVSVARHRDGRLLTLRGIVLGGEGQTRTHRSLFEMNSVLQVMQYKK